MKLSFLLIPLAFLSCKTVKKVDVIKNKTKETVISLNQDQSYNVEIAINTREPYCGGAHPREEDLNKVSVGAFSYLLINTTSNDTATIKSNTSGQIFLNLKVGNYEIRELYKDIPFDQFQKNNQPKANQKLLGNSTGCYTNWWSENFLKFEITEPLKVHKYKATINKMCFTGHNPCVVYQGRLPN